MALCLKSAGLLLMLLAITVAADKPEVATTKPVRVNGLDFSLSTPKTWTVNNLKPIPLGLVVTNHTGNAVTLDLQATVTVQLKGDTPKILRITPRPTRPLTLEKGATAVIDRDITIKPTEKTGHYRVSGTDEDGAHWHFDGLPPGKYAVRIAYKNVNAGPANSEQWTGEARTEELTIEIVEP
jgi:hypothetical protein